MSPFFKLILFLVCFGLGNTVQAQSRKQLEAKRKKVEQDIDFTRNILKKTSAKKTAVLHKLTAINEIIGQRKLVINGIKEEIQETDSEIVQRNSTLDVLKKNYREERLRLRKTVVQAYKTRKNANQLAFVFAANSFRKAIRRLKYIKKLADYRNFMISRIKASAANVKQGLDALESVKNEKVVLLVDNEHAKNDLEKDQKDKSRMVASLSGQESELRRKIRQNEQAIAKLNSAISNMIAVEIAAARKRAMAQAKPAAKTTSPAVGKAKTGSPTIARSSPAPTITLTPEARTLSNNFVSNRGSLPWPVERGYISQGFGVHPHPDLAGITMINNGVDISTSEGSIARAVFKGTVTAIFNIPGQERAILVNHGEFFTVYSRLVDISVSKGQEVSAKQVLGRIWTDDENKTILQFQVWQGQVKQNPAYWLAPR